MLCHLEVFSPLVSWDHLSTCSGVSHRESAEMQQNLCNAIWLNSAPYQSGYLKQVVFIQHFGYNIMCSFLPFNIFRIQERITSLLGVSLTLVFVVSILLHKLKDSPRVWWNFVFEIVSCLIRDIYI